MFKLELRRLTPHHIKDLIKYIAKYGNILETRLIEVTDRVLDLNAYFIKEFGEDKNGGISNALDYVSEKYGGGNFQLRVSSDDKYVQSNTFELCGLPKLIENKCTCVPLLNEHLANCDYRKK